MRAVLFDRFGETPEISDVPDPVPAPDGVVIRVEATGLCRSDWHGWMGHDPSISLPHVPGHEFAGTVVATGAGVTRWREGDAVTMPFVAGCGRCRECHAGDQQVCPNQFQPGFTGWGSFAEYVAVAFADLNLVRVPLEVSPVTAASLGCRFATAFRAVVDQGCVRPGHWVVVHGCGGVGLSTIMLARAAGANVVAVDVAEEPLALAAGLGARATLNASTTPSVVEAVLEATGGGAHVSFDAIGHPRACFDSIMGLRRRGRHVQIGLLLGEHAQTAVPMDRVIAYELEIVGSHGAQAYRYEALLDMIRAGTVAPERLIGRALRLDEAPAALATMTSRRTRGMEIVLPQQ